jgi:hypothetical protein
LGATMFRVGGSLFKAVFVEGEPKDRIGTATKLFTHKISTNINSILIACFISNSSLSRSIR